MLSFRHALRGCIVAAALALAMPLRAQRGASVEVFVGYYRPFGHFDPGSVVVAGELPEEPSDLSAGTWGGAGHLTLGHRFGVAAQLVSTIKSRVPAVATSAGLRGPTNATVTIGTFQAQYDLSPKPESYHVWVNAGPGFVRRGGDAYREYGSPTSFAGALGTTVAVPVSMNLQLVADATALFYNSDLPTPTSLRVGKLEHGNQRDALVRLGVAWGRR